MNEFLDRIVVGDVRASLKRMPGEFVNTCVTSPPYFGLRNYGTASQAWGGDTDCKHVWDHHRYYVEGGSSGKSGDTFTKAGPANAERLKKSRWREDDSCACGAWRGHLGLEPTPDMFVAHLVEVFREVRRVLRNDGTIWVNLGDSYAHPGTGGHGATGGLDKSTLRSSSPPPGTSPVKKSMPPGMKQKDLIGIPWMVAFALRADGWYLRQDIIWEKPNVMPESVTDRCTKSHEYIFMLSKSLRYQFDAEAIKEPAIYANNYRKGRGKIVYAKKRTGESTDGFKAQGQESFCSIVDKRNKRSVWRVPTKPFKGAHFASFPKDLITPCILAGSPRGGVVLDPFMGSGTTGLVSATHGRRYVGCELNVEYAEMAEARIAEETLGSLV